MERPILNSYFNQLLTEILTLRVYTGYNSYNIVNC